MTKIVWLLCDDRIGNINQCLGVGEALGIGYRRVDLSYGPMGRLPNCLLGARVWGLDSQSRAKITSPWPDLVIAAGRRTAPVACYIKKQSKGASRIVQIMDPGGLGAHYDLVFVPRHDARSALGYNERWMSAAPHALTPNLLESAKTDWTPRFSHLPRPLIALIVGGATKNKTFTNDMARDLASRVNETASHMGGALLVTTSRRTGPATQALKEVIKVDHFAYHWGDDGENPYKGFLACSDFLVVTGDSMSMCAEACATGKPVYIYAPSGMVSDKHARFHQSLYDGGYARPFEGVLEAFESPVLNSATEIADEVRQLIKTE